MYKKERRNTEGKEEEEVEEKRESRGLNGSETPGETSLRSSLVCSSVRRRNFLDRMARSF